ncbi:T9SS type A sorting domain-containing protein [Hymenobacter elongatus]|uniref:T9SS type A sorting domain-containing protein n=1 Tax=Hymenobacter elongatus TaxID=877208 RepID=A0A4Z0PQI1_9BACT|nr:T9SS type A sorting domain-containing protein [Hymenobacter elongatus]TGE19950.1 T9SS type A sorting domain-containing protein [Hymenobacter elongatus]
MTKKLLPLFLVLPLLAQAQTSPSIRLQPGPVIQLPAGANPSSIAVGSFDRNGKLDIAVAQRGLNNVAVYLQSATGTFGSAAATHPTGISPSSVVVAPITGPSAGGANDLVIASGPSSTLTCLANDDSPQGNFTALPPYYFGTTALSANPQLQAGYFDQTTGVDLAYTYDNPNQYHIGYFSQRSVSQFFTTYPMATRMTVYPTNTTELVYRLQPTAMVVMDFDGNGGQDVATTGPIQVNTQSIGHQVMVVLNERSLNTDWNFPDRSYSIISGGVRPVGLAAADLTGDLRPELAIINEGSNNVVVYRNDGRGDFISPTAYPVSGSPRKVAFVDFDQDSYKDLVVLTAEGMLDIFRHPGFSASGRYTTATSIAVGPDPTTLQTADINGDTYMDLIVGCQGDQTLRILLNSPQPLATRSQKLTGVEVFPNPAATTLTIRRPATLQGPLLATLFDALGRPVRQQPVPADGALGVEDLPRGMYLLHLQSQGQVSTRQIVLE